ncbi:MAG: gliding motility-associated C-terminal domain-containing protein, partial [Bacteroidia bacterium]|nr:gliding motility-associated C-terminal domain-containing protein [Bacteroidia bacterium]
NYSFNPAPLSTSVYPVTYTTTSTPNPNACPASSNLNISVTQTVIPFIPQIPEFCNNQPAFNLTVSPSGGVWYNNSAITSVGVLIPSLSVLSNSVVNYSVTVGPCKNYGSAVIYPSRFNTAALNSNNAQLCVTNNPVNMMTYVQSTVNGSWFGTGVSNPSFVPAGLPTNTYLLTYTCNSFPNATLCPDFSTFTMSVLNPVVPNILSLGPYCSKDAPIQMSVTPANGNWSPTSYLTASGVLIPSLCAVGNNAINYVVGNSTCFVQQTKNILVEAFVPATIVNSVPDLCNTSSPMNLMPITLSNSGLWSGPGISGTSFNPGLTGAGNFVLLYKTSSTPSGLCPDQNTVAVTVHSLATPVVTSIGPFCNINLPQKLIVSPVGGFFSGLNNSAVNSSGLFNPALGVVGNNIITYNISKGPCMANIQTTVQVQKFVPADFEKRVYSFCKTDEPFNLNSLVQNPGGIWSGPGMTGSVFNPTLANTGNGNVISYTTVSLPNATLCPDTSSIRINVDEIPKIEIKSLTPGGCVPFDALLSTSPQGMGGTGEWLFDDGSEKQQGLLGNHLYSTPGSYTVTFSYTLGSCHTIATLAKPLVVHEQPGADFNVEPEEIFMSLPNARLNNQSWVLGNNKYEWTIPGIGKYTDVNPELVFPKAGTYQITLLATSVYGCKDVVTKSIEVRNDFGIYFPNSFTPNSDGLNDVFMPFSTPYGLDPSGFEMEIFDRWGHSLYLTRDITKGWNGTLNNKGSEVEKDGVYVYKVKYKDLNGQLYNKVGSFTLLNK